MINLLEESNRCLVCKNARCQQNCPINTPIPEIITLYKENKIEEAGKILFKNNPLSAICAIVCPHENQCRGNCIRGIKGEPIHFHEIECDISTKYLENVKFNQPISNGIKVAVVGAGPAGITVAFELAHKGYDVTIFEKNERIGGILTYGIPEFRLPKTYITLLESHLKDLNIKIKINSLIGKVTTLDNLFNDGFKSIFIGTGVWNPRKLNIPGESLAHVHYAIDYLRSPSLYNLGDNVTVIGAGNVAMDAARSAKYNGSKNVNVYYRRDYGDMTATKHEIEEAKEEGVIFNTFKAPLEITDEGIKFIDTKKIENEDGSISLITIKNSETFVKSDSILIATGQVPRDTIVKNNTGLEVKRGGLLLTDENGQTTRKGVYACGDVSHGAKTVIEAVVSGKKIANSIDNYLKSL